MQKDFDRWNCRKKVLENHAHGHLPFHEREIWWCSLGLNLGDEQDGKNEYYERPVLVLKKFNNRVALVLPLTTQKKENRYSYPLEQAGLKRDSYLILSQIRLVSVKRFIRIMTKVPAQEFMKIQKRFIQILCS